MRLTLTFTISFILICCVCFAQEYVPETKTDEETSVLNEELRRLRKDVESNKSDIDLITGVTQSWVVQAGDTVTVSDGIITNIQQ